MPIIELTISPPPPLPCTDFPFSVEGKCILLAAQAKTPGVLSDASFPHNMSNPSGNPMGCSIRKYSRILPLLTNWTSTSLVLPDNCRASMLDSHIHPFLATVYSQHSSQHDPFTKEVRTYQGSAWHFPVAPISLGEEPSFIHWPARTCMMLDSRPASPHSPTLHTTLCATPPHWPRAHCLQNTLDPSAHLPEMFLDLANSSTFCMPLLKSHFSCCSL